MEIRKSVDESELAVTCGVLIDEARDTARLKTEIFEPENGNATKVNLVHLDPRNPSADMSNSRFFLMQTDSDEVSFKVTYSGTVVEGDFLLVEVFLAPDDNRSIHDLQADDFGFGYKYFIGKTGETYNEIGPVSEDEQGLLASRLSFYEVV